MSSPSVPPDNSVQVEQMQENAATQAQQQATAQAATTAANLAALRTSSAGNATTATDNYFTQQGLDPSQYSTGIDSQISQMLNGIDPSDPNPGATFDTAPTDIFNSLQSAQQAKNVNAVNSLFPSNFQTSEVPQDIVDPEVNSIESQQYNSADDIINNMLARGVITPAGQSAAVAELNRQAPGVTSQLQTLGQGTVADEQSSLSDIANNARQTAQTTPLGTSFDPSTYGTEADQNFNDFVNNLSTTLQGKVTGNLFNTTGLAAIAGAGQGAQNTNFDPTAAAGVVDPNADDGSTNSTTGQPTNVGASNASTSVF